MRILQAILMTHIRRANNPRRQIQRRIPRLKRLLNLLQRQPFIVFMIRVSCYAKTYEGRRGRPYRVPYFAAPGGTFVVVVGGF